MTTCWAAIRPDAGADRFRGLCLEVSLDDCHPLDQHEPARFDGMDLDPNGISSRERTVLIVLLVALGIGLVAIPPVREGILKDFRRKWDQDGRLQETGLVRVASRVDALNVV